MEVMGSLLTFCDSTFWSLVIDVYTYLLTDLRLRLCRRKKCEWRSLNIRASIPCGKYGLEANNKNLMKRV